jgi:FlaA1/EpsC-like NDP-sugar epimerase
LGFDIFSVFIGFFAANILFSGNSILGIDYSIIEKQSVIVVLSYSLGFLIAKSFLGIIRHTGQQDALRILKASFIGMMILILISSVSYLLGKGDLPIRISSSIVFIHFLLVLFALIGSRLIIKTLYHSLVSDSLVKKKNVLIYGAGTSGLITKQTLEKEIGSPYRMVGFIDDNSSKIGKSLVGSVVYSFERVIDGGFIEKHEISEVILSIQKLKSERKREIIESFLEKNIKVKVVPPVDRWIHGELSAKQIKAVRIEDLLQREPINLDNQNVTRELKDKIILVTGAAGSIGSEIVRQVMHYSPKKLILLDQGESPLYELEMELKSSMPELYHLVDSVIGSVSDSMRMRKLFNHFKPEIVFHAAAYKHVPLMENNPYEAVKVNVLGTKSIADLSIEFGIEKFVMVSTDKAVNPTNVMGATKRVSELYTQSRNLLPKIRTHFITTRFGNVLGSNGSVIPVFRKQIEAGGPITITHKEITRYFMTIPEACNLVLEAGAMGKGGEIFVFDMGESVKILDLARKMIKLSGLEEGRDIEIKFVGLRPGEKLYEELLATKEDTKDTHHPKIMIANVSPVNPDWVDERVNNMLSVLLRNSDNYSLVECLKGIVPEYLSNNSEYASLDLKNAINE